MLLHCGYGFGFSPFLKPLQKFTQVNSFSIVFATSDATFKVKNLLDKSF